MDTQTKTEIEAAAFRRLLEHLDENKEVQNIDLMNLAGFCRNCLSKWYLAAAEDKGIALDYEGAREVVLQGASGDTYVYLTRKAAATRIQAVVRGHFVRRRLAMAATRIQAAARRHFVRRQRGCLEI